MVTSRLRWQLRTSRGPVDVGTHGCWEEHGEPLDAAGPYTYACELPGVTLRPGDRALLRFGAVSYACSIAVDGAPVGGHRGMWDAFTVDVTAAVRDGRHHTLTVEAEKPASLTAGPDSPSTTGRYPAREVLAGFLPYVCGHSHGGIWQPVELDVVPCDGVVDWDAVTAPDGRIAIDAWTPRPAPDLEVLVAGPDGTVVASAPLRTTWRAAPGPAPGLATDLTAGLATGHVDVDVPTPQPWSPGRPRRYRVEIHTVGRSTPAVARSVGFRDITVGTAAGRMRSIGVGGHPVFPRLALSWGWYPDRLLPDPGPARVRRDMLRLRELGFNGVKLCLWYPPEYYFDVADELGMLLWLELPLWLPKLVAGFAEQAMRETAALVRQARRHPSVILYSLGCELGPDVAGAFLRDLWTSVKSLTGDALVCDNSGSGEAYGGEDESLTDFYDHHLYAEPPFLPGLFDYFSPGWRPPKPWLLGEFCDYDTARWVEGTPWWASRDPAVNPRGARWQYDLPWLAERLTTGGWSTRREELVELSRRRALLHRKVTLEYVRARLDVSGYVVTGERDTPISTSGVLDDAAEPKLPAERMASFNADNVLLVAPVRRRRWVAGGDRPAPPDPWCHPAGSGLRLDVLLAHAGAARVGPVRWAVRDDSREYAAGTVLPLGRRYGDPDVSKLGTITADLPDRTGAVELSVQAEVDGAMVANSWTHWLVPRDPLSRVGPFSVFDPSNRFPTLAADPARLCRELREAPPEHPLLATRWTADLSRWIAAGGHALVALDGVADAPFPLVPLPFWRESVAVIEDHPAWSGFPHGGGVEMQFFGVATDLAIDLDGVAGLQHLLRRVDTRTGRTHDYAAIQRRGAGRGLITTMRFEGGSGSQPVGLEQNVAGSALLAAWLTGLRPDAAGP